jgi:F0F1-type ATP synthase membrane subunit c/vacuolar-type H+-ATPase subunit K
MPELLVTLLFFLPPLIGLLIAFVIGKSGRDSALEEFSTDPEIEMKHSRTMGKFIVMLVMPVTAIIFSFAIWFLGLSHVIAEEVWFAMGVNMGLAGFFTATGCAAIIHMGAKDVIKDEKKFGKYLTLMELPVTTVIFSFALTFLTMGDTIGDATELAKANYIMGIASAGALVSGVTMRAAGPVSDDHTNFGRVITFGIFGIMISTVGFAYAFLVLGAA